MTTFTVVLSSHNTSLSFNQEEFTQKFPDSLITRTLELTHESIVPISNPIVTLESLELLKNILKTSHYPYIPDIMGSSIRKSLDYLGIDVPNVIYYPQYKQLLDEYYGIFTMLDNPKDYYKEFYEMARKHNFPQWISYLFDHTNPTEHKEVDYDEFVWMLNDNYVELLILILRRRDIESYFIPANEAISISIIHTRSPELIKAYVSTNPKIIKNNYVVRRILSGMLYDPLHYKGYLQELEAITPYIPHSCEEHDLYNLFMVSYSGRNSTDVSIY